MTESPATHSIRSPLARARGLGSAKNGTHHWWMQRITAVALVPLTLWFMYSVLVMMTLDYWVFLQWLADPINAIMTILFVTVMLYHATLGCQVIIEDYVHHKATEITLLVILKFSAWVLAIAAVFSVLKVSFGV